MLLDMVNIILESISRPSILFVVPIFLATLTISSHQGLQGISHMVSFLGVVAYWSGVFLIAGPSMSPVVVL